MITTFFFLQMKNPISGVGLGPGPPVNVLSAVLLGAGRPREPVHSNPFLPNVLAG